MGVSIGGLDPSHCSRSLLLPLQDHDGSVHYEGLVSPSSAPALKLPPPAVDWVMWLDADTVITNPDVQLEELLPDSGAAAEAAAADAGAPNIAAKRSTGISSGAAGSHTLPVVQQQQQQQAGISSGIDLVITRDANGFNAGVWLLRNSDWARTRLLHSWWYMGTADPGRYVRSAAAASPNRNKTIGSSRKELLDQSTKSGDNDALKDLLEGTMQQAELAQHVGIAPQCAFNSYLWRGGSVRQWLRWLLHPRIVTQGLHKPGHLLLHLAGVQDKVSAVKQALAAAQSATAARATAARFDQS